MDRTKKYLITAFISVLIIVALISFLGMILLGNKPTILQGQIEATEIRISGKLPGRIDTFLVKEGQNVSAGDTLVIINSPEARAKYEQVNALENVAKYQNQKIDEGTRSQIIETMFQMWSKAKSDLQLAKTTYDRILTLYKDSVVTSQRKDEVEAIYKAAIANEKAAYQQYLMALDGAQKQDKESARSLVNAAKGTVNEVEALLQDAKLTAPESGQIASIYPKRVSAVVVSCQHEDGVELAELRHAVMRHIIQPTFQDFPLDAETEILINPSGRFVEGGFEADTGLTGRKLMVDTYGGLAPHGGGALSGKDGTKVDRSGAYMARYVAKNIVAAGLAERCTVSLAYAIGKAKPVMVEVDAHGTGKYSNAALEQAVRTVCKLTPNGMIDTLGLDKPIFRKFCNYGHFTHADAPWEQTDMTEVLESACRAKETGVSAR